jgi:hypothetical protein
VSAACGLDVAHPGLAELDQDVGGDLVPRLDDDAPCTCMASTATRRWRISTGCHSRKDDPAVEGRSLIAATHLWAVPPRKARRDRMAGEGRRPLGIGPALRFGQGTDGALHFSAATLLPTGIVALLAFKERWTGEEDLGATFAGIFRRHQSCVLGLRRGPIAVRFGSGGHATLAFSVPAV